MAKYYEVRADYTGFVSDLSAALVDYYDDGVTIHYAQSGYVIFSCPAVSSKVIRGYYAQLAFSYGDAWTSGSSITNAVTFHSQNSTIFRFVLGDSFIWGQGTYSGVDYPFLIGKTVGGSSLIMGSYRCVNVTSGNNTKPILFGTSFKDGATGKLYKQPVYFAEFSGALLMNGTVPDTVPGVYAISYPRQRQSLIRQSYLISVADGSVGSTSSNLSNHILHPIYLEYDADYSLPQGWLDPKRPFV